MKTKRSLYRNVFNDRRTDDIGRCEPHEKKKEVSQTSYVRNNTPHRNVHSRT